MVTRKLSGEFREQCDVRNVGNSSKRNDHAMDILEASLSGNLMSTLEHLQKVLMGLEQRIHDIEQELSRRNGL